MITLLLLLLVSNLITWLLSLLLQCGDIETNPGTDSVEGSTADSSDLSATTFEQVESQTLS